MDANVLLGLVIGTPIVAALLGLLGAFAVNVLPLGTKGNSRPDNANPQPGSWRRNKNW